MEDRAMEGRKLEGRKLEGHTMEGHTRERTGTPRGGEEEERVVPELPHPPELHHLQDTQEVEGEAAIHPPPEAELIQRSRVQG